MWVFAVFGCLAAAALINVLALPLSDGRTRKVLVQWTVLLVLVSLVPKVSWAAHLGGFVGGLVPGLLIRWGARREPTAPFRIFDRLVLPLLLVAAVAVWLVVRLHLTADPGTFRA